MKVLSLFDGISCGRAALERAGIPVENYAAYEIDRYAVQTALKNYPDICQCGNVFDGDFTKYKGYDLLLGAVPVHIGLSPKRTGKQHRTVKVSGCLWSMYAL